jgi:phosphoglycerol transferase MdoB-like AlkP superfamily enzyme
MIASWNRLFRFAFLSALLFSGIDFVYLPVLSGNRPESSESGVFLFLHLAAFTVCLFYFWAVIFNGLIALADGLFRKEKRSARALFFTSVASPFLLYVSYLLFQGAGISKHPLSKFGPAVVGSISTLSFFGFTRFLVSLRQWFPIEKVSRKAVFAVLLALDLAGVIFLYWATSHLYIRGYSYLHVTMVSMIVAGTLLFGCGLLKLVPEGKRRVPAFLTLLFHLALLGGASAYAFIELDENAQNQYLLSNHAVLTRRTLHVYYTVKDRIRQQIYARKFERIYQDLERMSFAEFDDSPKPAPDGSIRRGSAEGMNVLWIMIDTLRADHVGFYGYGRDTTPHFDALARRSLVFKNAFSQYPYTNYSVLSFWHSRFFPKPDTEEVPLLGESLRERGYQTAWITPIDGVMPMSEDFQTMELLDRAEAPKITERALQKLSEIGDSKFLLWVHYFEPHLSYDTEGEVYHYYGDEKKDLYDGAVRMVDRELEKLFQALRDKGLDRNTLIVIHADHGQEHYERGSWTHAFTVYNEMLHVPLLIHVPGAPPGSFDAAVRLVDLLPTLYDLLGLDSASLFEGKSLLSVVNGGEEKSRLVFARRDEHFEAARRNDWKLIQALQSGVLELYDLKRDPGEKTNLVANEPETAEALEDLLKEFRYLHDSWQMARKFRKGVDAERLIRAYEQSGGPSKKKAILNYLGYSKSRQALLFLVNVLRSESDESVRKLAAWKLRRFPFVEAGEALEQSVLKDPSTEVRMAALAAFFTVHGTRAERLLEKLLKDPETPKGLKLYGKSLTQERKEQANV